MTAPATPPPRPYSPSPRARRVAAVVLALAVAGAIGFVVLAVRHPDVFAKVLFGGQMAMIEQDVVLTDQPFELGPAPRRFAPSQPLQVKGLDSEVCVVLARNVSEEADMDAQVARYKQGAHLSAVLHAKGGKDYAWSCGSWSYSSGRNGTGDLSMCLRSECNREASLPPGTELTAIDLGSDRPLRVHGATWNSTSAFDHLRQPPADPFAVMSPAYSRLEQAYGSQAAWPTPARTALQVGIRGNGREDGGSATYNSVLGIRLAEAGVQFEPLGLSLGVGVVTIPADAIAACSQRCFAADARHTLLLLEDLDTQVDLLNDPATVDWCFSRHKPMLGREARDAWEYHDAPLPGPDAYAAQFESRAAYDHAADQSCMGY